MSGAPVLFTAGEDGSYVGQEVSEAVRSPYFCAALVTLRSSRRLSLPPPPSSESISDFTVGYSPSETEGGRLEIVVELMQALGSEVIGALLLRRAHLMVTIIFCSSC